jgi:hypothetical protein
MPLLDRSRHPSSSFHLQTIPNANSSSRPDMQRVTCSQVYFLSVSHVSRSCASRSLANPREENYAVSDDSETVFCV